MHTHKLILRLIVLRIPARRYSMPYQHTHTHKAIRKQAHGRWCAAGRKYRSRKEFLSRQLRGVGVGSISSIAVAPEVAGTSLRFHSHFSIRVKNNPFLHIALLVRSLRYSQKY